MQSETKSIDGLELTTTLFPALQAFGLWVRLGKVLAPASDIIIPLLTGTASHTLLMSDAGPAITSVFAQLDEGVAQSLTREMFQLTTVRHNNKIVQLVGDDSINLVFSGKLSTMLKALQFVAKANFADFFPTAPAVPSEPAGAVNEPTKAPQ